MIEYPDVPKKIALESKATNFAGGQSERENGHVGCNWHSSHYYSKAINIPATSIPSIINKTCHQ